MLFAIRAIERLNVIMGVLAGLTILAITLIVVADVTMRALFAAPIPGATESSTLLLIGLVYLGFASVQVSKDNFRVEVLIMSLPPRWRRWQEFVIALIAAGAVGTFAWLTGIEALHSTLRGEMSYGAIAFPVWPARLTIAFGLALLTLQLICDCLRQLLGAVSNEGADEERVLH